MSVRKIKRASGRQVWEVRWNDGNRKPSRSFDFKQDADDFAAHIRRAKQRDGLESLERGTIKFGDFADRWWDEVALEDLALSTQGNYSTQLHLRVVPKWGETELRRIGAPEVTSWLRDMNKDGVGWDSIIKSRTVMQSCLRYAVELGEIESNPVRGTRLPKKRKQTSPKSISPMKIEQLRRHLLAGPNGERNAALVSVIAYGGLRPQEALALTWDAIGKRVIRVTEAAAFQELKETKNEAPRSVKIMSPLRSDLERWAEHSPSKSGLIFPDSRGGVWNENMYRSWARGAIATGSLGAIDERITPYTLRHSFATLLIHCGISISYVAEQMGNSVAITLKHYAGVFDDLDTREDPEEVIWAAKQSATTE